jgi:hypothetical protein
MTVWSRLRRWGSRRISFQVYWRRDGERGFLWSWVYLAMSKFALTRPAVSSRWWVSADVTRWASGLRGRVIA